MVRGVLSYVETVDHWRFVSFGDQPTIDFDAIDLTAVDGVLVSVDNPAQVEALQRANIAAVNMSNLIQDIALPRVANDDPATGRMGAEYLLGKGFKVFGFVGQERAWFSRRRHEAFSRVIEQAAGRACHACVLDVKQPDKGVAAVRHWLGEVPKPIAVMAATDLIGRTIIDCAVALGLRVPDDVAVLGVDNYQWMSALARTSMSSVEPDWQQIGYRAAQMLDGLMAGEIHSRPRRVVPLRVVTRRSTDIALADDPIVVDALGYIRDHCTQGVVVEDVLDELGVSRRSLEMRMKRSTGQTPLRAIHTAQVDVAKRLLTDSELHIGQIAHRCGFDQQARLNHLFKRVTGMTPSQYRRQHGLRQAMRR